VTKEHACSCDELQRKKAELAPWGREHECASDRFAQTSTPTPTTPWTPSPAMNTQYSEEVRLSASAHAAAPCGAAQRRIGRSPPRRDVVVR
jgi:hypothetical protein